MTRYATIFVLLLGGAGATATTAVTQELVVGFNPPPARSVLEWYREPVTSSQHRDGATVITIVFRRHQEFPAAYVDSLVAGLEKAALSDTAEAVRMAAASDLATLASDLYGMTPRSGAMQQMRSLYRRTSDPMVRLNIVSALPTVADRATAVAWLKEIARQRRESGDFPDAAHQAIGTLLKLGEEGRAALRELHRDRAQIPDSQIRSDLESLAREGFPVVDPKERERRHSPEREHPPHH